MGRKKINTDTVEEIVKNTFKSKITVKGKKLSDNTQPSEMRDKEREAPLRQLK